MQKNKDFYKSIFSLTIIFAAFVFFFYSFFFLNNVKAQQQASGNILRGWLWSSNIGWVSVNCEDQGVCGAVSYRVQLVNGLNNSQNLIGYAWSSNIGWIDFSPQGPYPAAPQRASFIDLSGALGGWMRACNVFQNGCSGALKNPIELGGWDGWIKIVDAKLFGNKITDGTGSVGGWAWGGDVVGWLNFYDVTKQISGVQLPPLKPSPQNPGQIIEVSPR